MDDDDTEPPAPGTEEDAGTRPALPPGTAVTNVPDCSGFFCVSTSDFCASACVFRTLFILLLSFSSSVQLLEAWGPSAKGQKRQKCGQQNKAIIGSSPILYTQSAVSAGKTITS